MLEILKKSSSIFSRAFFAVTLVVTALSQSACYDHFYPQDDLRVDILINDSKVSAPRVLTIDRYDLTFAPAPGLQFPLSLSEVFSISQFEDERPSLRVGDFYSVYSSAPPSYRHAR